jgi:predicted ribonuclease YlaK
MPDGDVPVIAKRVLEELDGLKSGRVGDGPEGELRAKSARQAVAAIEAAGGRVIFEPSRRDQCARDWPATPDNEILSVAVFHALNDVVLVSADRNLRNKAQAETLRAMDTDQYLSASGRVRPAPQPPKTQPRRQTTR